MKKISGICDWVIKMGAYASGGLVLLTVIMVFYEVIARSLFHKPTIWATELSIYAIIGSCFLGGAYAVRTYSHVTVDLLINALNDRWKTIFFYLSSSLGLVFSIIFTIYGFIHVGKTLELGETSSSLLRIPMYLPKLFLPIGGILLCLAFFLQIADPVEQEEGGDHV